MDRRTTPLSPERKALPVLFGRRAVFAAALASVFWSALTYVSGGSTWTVGPLKLSSRSFERPLIAALILIAAHVWRWGRTALEEDSVWLLAALRRGAAPVALAAAAVVFYISATNATFTASGSDPYGYVSQADLWLARDLRVVQPLAALPPPLSDRAFSPLGYRPTGHDHMIVPTYPPGLPLLMAGAKAVAGQRALYLVVPTLGALAVWLCYLLGGKIAGPGVGALAAIGLAVSPPFLFMLMPPMSDIPAMAFWTAALLLTLDGRKYAPLAAGLCCGIAIAIRPNLAPLAAIPVIYLMRSGWKAFLLGAAPGVVLVALVNAYLNGSPFASGYGSLDALYAWHNAPANVRRYGAWLFDADAAIAGLALLAIARRPRGARLMLAAFAAGVFASYLFYAPFDAWWYLRFLLPAFPVLMILAADSAAWLASHTPSLVQAIVLASVPILFVNQQVRYAADHGVFRQREIESRYQQVGAYVDARTPANAVVLSMQHSGSVRYYGHRVSLRYDFIAPESLDAALALLREHGYQPFIVLDDWEESNFKQRFAGSAVGRLDWTPAAEFRGADVYEVPARR